jgi:hypothetical protein
MSGPRRRLDRALGIWDAFWGFIFTVAGIAIAVLGIVRDEPSLLIIGAVAVLIGVMVVVVLGPRRAD